MSVDQQSLQIFPTDEWEYTQLEMYAIPNAFEVRQSARQHLTKYYGAAYCMKCGTNEPPIQLDHIFPKLSYPEFEHKLDNFQWLCKSCNRDKGYAVVDYRPA